MYYLEEKQFAPSMILSGIIFVPMIVAAIIANILSIETDLTILLLGLLIGFVVVTLINWKLCQRKNHYLLLKETELEISFLDHFHGETLIKLPFDCVAKIEYHRLNSLKGWLMLFSFTYPRCVCMTYIVNEKEETKFIGYLTYKDVKNVAEKMNTKLVVY